MSIKDIEKIIKPPMGEVGVSETADIYKDWVLSRYNPDELITAKGYEIIQKMMDDAHVGSCMDTLKLGSLSKGFEIEPASDKRIDVKIADFVWYCLVEEIEGSFKDDLLGILTGIENGWSLSEINWKVIDRGEWKGKYGIKSIKSKNVNDYQPRFDKFFNLTGLTHIGADSDYGKDDYDLNKFIFHSFWKKYENLFGKSVLRRVYRHWWSKNNLIKFWNIFLNKFGMPTAMAKYPRNANSDERQKLEDAIKSIQTETGITIPEDFQIEFIEATRKGQAGFDKAIDMHNAEMSKAILGATLTAEQTKVGSYALGEVHFDVMIFRVDYLQGVEDDVTNEQLIRRLVDINFPNVDYYPKFKLKSVVEANKQKQIELWNESVEKGAIKKTTIEDENHVRDTLGFPEREETEEEKEQKEEDKKPKAQREKEQKEKEVEENKEQGGQEGSETGEGVNENMDFQARKKKRRAELTVYEERVDFTEVEARFEDRDSFDKLVEIVDKQIKDVEKQIVNKKLIEVETSVKEIDNIQIRYLSEMRTVISDMLNVKLNAGVSDVEKEVKRGTKNFTVGLDGLPPKRMLNELEKIFKDKAFHITGIIRDDIKKQVTQSIYNGKLKGKTTKQVIFDIEKKLKPYLETGQLTPDKDGVLRVHTAPRLETVVRTNISEAYNQGRMAEFRALRELVQSLQYSAVLDDRTRDEHEALDGAIYPLDDPIWDVWYPPNGYSCRCIAVAVLKGEKHQISKPPPKTITVETATGKKRTKPLKPDTGFE